MTKVSLQGKIGSLSEKDIAVKSDLAGYATWSHFICPSICCLFTAALCTKIYTQYYAPALPHFTAALDMIRAANEPNLNDLI